MQDDTRVRILDAAERLFAERGFDGTSVREIVRSAGVNVAAVHYHFGSKEAVLRGVTDRVAGPITARRAELLAAATSATPSGRPEVREILDAFVRADVEILLALQQRGPAVARFLGRTYSDQTPWIQEMAASQYEASRSAHALLAVALPDLDAAEVSWRMARVVAVIVNIFATWPEAGLTPAEAEDLLTRLVTFLAAGMSAPATVPAVNPSVNPSGNP